MSDPILYTIGWISAISTEQTAARQFLDEQHDQPEYVSPHDNNSYTLGRIGKHNVVIATLPDGEYGECSATAVARDMLSSFPNVRVALMVGIGGGASSPKHDIRLGDVVVSSPAGEDGGVFQYDFGKTIRDQEFKHTRHLDKPPTILRTTVSSIKSQHEEAGTLIDDAINSILSQKPRLKKKYSRPDASTDQLYKSSYIHQSKDGPCEEHCDSDGSNIVQRQPRGDEDDNPAIHYGLIASANQLMKDATIRDALIKEKDVLCFEMEAAGLMNHFPCLVIRGICDYADSHKNKQWQGYAAMTAAAYAKQVIEFVAPTGLENMTRLAETLKSVENEVIKVSSMVNEMNIGTSSLVTEAKLQRLRVWLSPQDPSNNHNNAVSLCQRGTGQWFIQGETFQDFKRGRIPFLWLNGIPGCGKTIISSSIIEDLKQDPAMHSFRQLYFYFDFNDAQKMTLESALRSLLWQASISPGHGSNFQELEQLYRSCDSGETQPSAAELIKALEKELQFRDTTIVVDALDECPARQHLLAWLSSLASRIGTVRLIATSRDYQDIEVAFEQYLHADATVSLQDQVIGKDIAAYVKYRLQTDAELQRWRGQPAIQGEIEAKLMDGAHGMFRWAKCQLDALAECLSYVQLSSALTSLPPTLDATYARMLDRIPKRYLEQSIRLLQVLLWSGKALSLEEAVEFLAINPESEPGFDATNRMPEPKEITRLCPGLVTVTEEITDLLAFGGVQQRIRKSTMVQLTHFSVKEFLTSDELHEDWRRNICQSTAAERIASVSLAYILATDQVLHPPHSESHDLPLHRYCCDYWMTFARLAGDGSQTLQQLTMRLFLDQKRFQIWRNSFGSWHPQYRFADCPRGKFPEPLYYACMGGLEFAANALIARGADVDDKAGKWGNAMQAAIQNGRRNMITLLLDNGADVESPGNLDPSSTRFPSFSGGHITALCAAVHGRESEIAKLLLERGADPNAEGYFGTALQTACHVGSQELTLELLDRGADINAPAKIHASPLAEACARGDMELTNLLLRRGADITCQSSKCRNAIVAACANGHLDLAALLLERGANINACGDHYGDALQNASFLGLESVVQWLLDNGADVNAKGGCYHEPAKHMLPGMLKDGDGDLYGNARVTCPAIHLAAERGHRNVAAILLNNGADINVVNSHGATPLSVALQRGQAAVIDLLLETATDKPEELEKSQRFLEIAAYQRREDIVQMLLSHGAHIDAVDSRGRTALHRVVQCGHQPATSILLKKGADPNVKDFCGQSALDLAIEMEQHEIVELLSKETETTKSA